jgi:hypothetical protein
LLTSTYPISPTSSHPADTGATDATPRFRRNADRKRLTDSRD